MTGATRREVTLPGIRVSSLHWAAASGAVADRHRKDSRPPTAVVVHGLQSAAGVQVRLGDALAERGWRVVAPDLPGHGETRWLGEDGRDLEDQESVPAERYRLESVVEVVTRALAHRTLDAAAPDVIVGHSWGAGIAAGLVLAGLRPRRAYSSTRRSCRASPRERWARSSRPAWSPRERSGWTCSGRRGTRGTPPSWRPRRRRSARRRRSRSERSRRVAPSPRTTCGGDGSPS